MPLSFLIFFKYSFLLRKILLNLLRVLFILNSLNLDPKDGIYVGDSDVDTYTARNIGMPSIILSYGYGDKKLISESKPDYYIDDFRDIIKLI